MADLKNPVAIKVKGVLFLLIGITASALLLFNAPSLQNAFLLCMAVWGFARFYYFAFYVIEHYVDPTYRFASLITFAKYLLRKPRK